MVNPTNDQTNNAVNSAAGTVATKEDEAKAAASTTNQDAPKEALNAAKDAVTGLKNKIFGAVKRTPGA